MSIRDEKTKEAFITYLKDHPAERFFQAVRNFSGYPFIYASGHLIQGDSAIIDTFYIEGDKDKSHE